MMIFLSVRVRAEVKQVRLASFADRRYLSWSSANVWRVGFFFAMVLHPFIRAPTTSTRIQLLLLLVVRIAALMMIDDDSIRARS